MNKSVLFVPQILSFWNTLVIQSLCKKNFYDTHKKSLRILKNKTKSTHSLGLTHNNTVVMTITLTFFIVTLLFFFLLNFYLKY